MSATLSVQMWIQDNTAQVVTSQPVIADTIMKKVLEQEGWWVPKKWTTDGGAELHTVFKERGDLKVTRVSALPTRSAPAFPH